MTEQEVIVQTNIEHFFTAVNIFVVVINLLLLDIHWMIMGSGLSLFFAAQTVLVYNRFNNIFIDYIVVAMICQIFVFIPTYKKLKVQKISFLKSKKIQSLLKEQVKIFQNLPDGAIIHRRLIEGAKESDQKLKVMPREKININLRYLNLTFQDMFMGYKEKLKTEKKNRLNQTTNERYVDVSPSQADDSTRKIISEEKSIDLNNCSEDTV